MSTLVKWGCVLFIVVVVVACACLFVNTESTWQGIGNPVVPTPPNAYFSDYPMNMEMRSTQRLNKEDVIYLTHKVTYDGTTEKYLYYIRVELKGSSVILFKWDVLWPVMDGLLELGPDKPLEFTHEHESPPTMFNGNVMIYQKRGNEKVWNMTLKRPQLGPWPSGMLLPAGRNEIQRVVD